MSIQRTVAVHEAGHAVMRYLLELPLTDIWIAEDHGKSEGTGEPIERWKFMLLLLAGAAAEEGCPQSPIDFEETDMDDIDLALSIVGNQDAVNDSFRDACDDLRPYLDLVNQIADRLLVNGNLTASELSEIIANYEPS